MSDFVNRLNEALEELKNLGRKRTKNENLSYTEFKPLDEEFIIGEPKNIKKRDENNKDNFRKFVRRKYRC